MREALGGQMYINFELGSDRLCGFLVGHSQELGSICVSIRTLPELMIETSLRLFVCILRDNRCALNFEFQTPVDNPLPPPSVGLIVFRG